MAAALAAPLLTAVFPLAGAGAEGAGDITQLLAALVAVLLATRVLGELAQRLGQPAVLGELVAGVVLGGSALGLLDPSHPAIEAFSEIGVLVLLFEIGLNTDLRSLARVGSQATTVALVGVALPFGLGFAATSALGVATIPALVCGAALTATSIGISARVLSDLGRLESLEGQIVLGAAVIDDVVGLIILSVVAGIVSGAGVTAGGIAWTTAVALGFVAAAVYFGGRVAPPLFRFLERARSAGALGIFGLAAAFLMAWLAARAGSALVVGAFAAGLVLHRTPQRQAIESATTSLGHFFVPIFFASVGAAVDLRSFASGRALGEGAVLIVAAVLGKVATGYVLPRFRGSRLLVGVAMIPRGEVGLIFAQMGLATGAIGRGFFGSIMLMVLVTTFITPPLLGMLARQVRPEARVEMPGEGGIDDLVSGVALGGKRAPTPRATPPAPRSGGPGGSGGDA